MMIGMWNFYPKNKQQSITNCYRGCIFESWIIFLHWWTFVQVAAKPASSPSHFPWCVPLSHLQIQRATQASAVGNGQLQTRKALNINCAHGEVVCQTLMLINSMLKLKDGWKRTTMNVGHLTDKRSVLRNSEQNPVGGRRFCVFAAFWAVKGIESIEDWMRAN